MILRDYQREAIDDLESRWAQGAVRVPQVLATGLGKTIIFAHVIQNWLNTHPGQRALVIAHTDELISQAMEKIKAVALDLRTGRVQGQQYNNVLAECIVSSRQTLAREARRSQLKHVGLIVIDECHHATRHNTYGKILEHFGAFDDPSPVQVAGFTATLSRADKQKLSSVWEECTFTRDILFGIRHGYLLDVRGERIIVPDLDLSRVRMSGGDYRESDLGEELERTFAPEVIAKEYAKLADGRRGMAFWPLVDIAHHGADAFNNEGVRSATVSGVTPKKERRELLQRFRLPLTHDEAINVMHNAMVLTEGFDEPTADVVVIARPSKNNGLIQQMVGRVLRPDLTLPPGQRQKALILDVRGQSAEGMSLRALVDLSPERARKVDEYDGDLSLLDMDEYLQAAMDDVEEQRGGSGFIVESDVYAGDVATETFDPLGRDKVWGKTLGGSYFISAGGVAYVFVVESLEGNPGTYDIVMCSKHPYVRDGVTPWVKGTEHTALPLDMALSWGEELAVRTGGSGTSTLTGRKSSWRKGEPTQNQMKLALSFGIPGVTKTDTGLYESTRTKGDLSEAIDLVSATRRIDPIVAMVTKGRSS